MRIGVFGCGNMGHALVLGMKAEFPSGEFFLYTPTKIKADELAATIGGKSLAQISDMPRDLDWYLLAFKPQSLDGFNFDFLQDTKIISVLAGVNTAKLSEKFKTHKIARLMPNTPSALGLGANLLFLRSAINQGEVDKIKLLLNGAGKIFLMNTEEDLDLTTAFSASGPALIFELARIFEAELNRKTEGRVPAKEIVAQTFFGSASLINSVLQSNLSFEELRNQVTSKKGVTYEALEILKNNHLQKIMASAFEAAFKRTIELSK